MYRKENLRILRRYLGQTQKEFIEYFLKSEANEKPMSIATLSNLEAKGGKRLNEVIAAVSEKLSMDPMIFMMDSEEFAEQIDVLVPKNADTESIRKSAAKKSGINQLINQLTLYFAEQIFEKIKKRR